MLGFHVKSWPKQIHHPATDCWLWCGEYNSGSYNSSQSSWWVQEPLCFNSTWPRS